jgi:hypothetical protein
MRARRRRTTVREAIGYVVRDVTGEEQLSIRFLLRQHAVNFAEQCAMPVRIWRVVRRRDEAEPVDKGAAG